MLVLTRKVGERIQLGDNITVTLVKIQGNAVRLGIDAPAEMPIVRTGNWSGSLPNGSRADELATERGKPVPS
jgi:hypothetical protein